MFFCFEYRYFSLFTKSNFSIHFSYDLHPPRSPHLIYSPLPLFSANTGQLYRRCILGFWFCTHRSYIISPVGYADITDCCHGNHMSLVSSYRLAYRTPQAEREARRCTIRQVAGRVGEWMVFRRSEFCPGVYAPDDPDARGGDGYIGGESPIHRHSRMVPRLMRD